MKLQNDLSERFPCSVSRRTSLKPFTTLKTGGEAEYYCEPRTPDEAAGVLQIFHHEKIPVRFLGGGSNVLIPDEGFAGAVISTAAMKKIIWDGELLKVWAGDSFPGLVHDAAERGMSGLEGFVGIPGSIGGAIRMNSGGRHGEIWDRVVEVELLKPDGKRKTLTRSEANPLYRDGNLGSDFCIAVTLRLSKSNSQTVRQQTAKVLEEKAAAQPLTERSAGCVFKNPHGVSAGKSVDQAGCKGWSEGAAFVSEKHGNFIVNRGGAKSSEVKKLIERVRNSVKEKLGVSLDLEIDIW